MSKKAPWESVTNWAGLIAGVLALIVASYGSQLSQEVTGWILSTIGLLQGVILLARNMRANEPTTDVAVKAVAAAAGESP